MDKINIGIVQFSSLTGQVKENLKTAIDGIHALSDKGADIAVLPEMFSCSFDNENLKRHGEETPEILRSLKQTARQKNIIIAASMPEIEGSDIFNTLYLIDRDGELAGSYRKVHLFSPTGEDLYFTNGTSPVVCNTSAGNIGLMICYDLRFPELCRKLTDMNAQIIIVSAQWPTKRVEHWDTLLRARAIENQVFIIAANRCGESEDLEFPGHSQIISPWGKVLAAGDNTFQLLTAEIDLNQITDARKTIPCLAERVYKAY